MILLLIGTLSFATPTSDYEVGDYASAVEGFIAVLVEDPTNPEALFNLGAAQFKAGELEAAAASFQSAADLSDGALKAKSLFNLGNTAHAAEKLDEAVSAFAQSLNIDPSDPDVQHNLELVLRQKQEQEENQGEPQDNEEGEEEQEEQEEQEGEEEQEEQEEQEGEDEQEEQGDDDEEESDSSEASGDEQEQEQAAPVEMSQQEAQRLLDALEEKRPVMAPTDDRPPPNDKDW